MDIKGKLCLMNLFPLDQLATQKMFTMHILCAEHSSRSYEYQQGKFMCD